MKRAVNLPQYKDGVKPFTPPTGIVEVKLDKLTNNIATPVCPNDYDAAFITGTEPNQTCEMTAGDQRNIFQKLLGVGPKPPTPIAVANPQQPTSTPPPAPQEGQPVASNNGNNANNDDPNKKKKGFFGKLFGSIKGDNKDENQPQSSPPQPAPR